jgi:hypothetical protein
VAHAQFPPFFKEIESPASLITPSSRILFQFSRLRLHPAVDPVCIMLDDNPKNKPRLPSQNSRNLKEATRSVLGSGGLQRFNITWPDKYLINNIQAAMRDDLALDVTTASREV